MVAVAAAVAVVVVVVLLVVVILVVVPVRVDDLYVGDRSVSVAHRDVAQRRDVEVGATWPIRRHDR